MKVRSLFTVFFLIGAICTTVLYLQAAETTPQTRIITEAMQKKDDPGLIKSLITYMKEGMEKDTESLPDLIREVEGYAGNTDNPATVAILHSMLAEMYRQYYIQNGWKINQRTPLSGYIPDDIREWSSNLFTEKIKELLDQSLEPATLLQQTPVSQYSVILKSGKDSPELRPTLFEFLTWRAIRIAPADEYYARLIRYLETQSNQKALVLAELDRLKLNNTFEESYRNALEELRKKYVDKPFVVEVIEEQLNYLQMNRYRNNNPDSVKAIEYKLIKETLDKYKSYERIGVISNRLEQLEQPMIIAELPNTTYPGKEMKVKLQYRNIPGVKIELYESKRTLKQTSINNRQSYDSAKKDSYRGKLLKEWDFSLPTGKSYEEKDTVLTISAPEKGIYEYRISVPGSSITPVDYLVGVTQLAALQRTTLSSATEIVVTDMESGKPIPEAEVIWYEVNNNDLSQAGSAKTDKQGFAVIPPANKLIEYHAILPGDTAMVLTRLYGSGYETAFDPDKSNLVLFTDRGLYRPGQTLFFKGIAYESDLENPKVIANKSYEVILRDANNKEVATQKFTTNSFGSFHGEFVLPQSGLSGYYSISANNAYQSFRVEEYKRPTFKVEMDSVKEEVKFGEKIMLTGSAQNYSGVNVQEGTVSYRINRSQWLLRGYFFPQGTEQVATGETQLDEKGRFRIEFTPEAPATNRMLGPVYLYEVITLVTDSKGESQKGRYTFSIGQKSILLSMNILEKENKETFSPKIEAFTVNRKPVSVTGNYMIYSLTESDPSKNEFREGRQLANGTFTTEERIPNSIFRQLPSGRIRIRLTANDSFGQPVEYIQDVILYGQKDRQPPVFSPVWLPETELSALPGEKVFLRFGSSLKKVNVLYEIFDEQKLITRKWVDINNEIKDFEIPFDSSYGKGINVSFTFIQEGKVYKGNTLIKRKYPDRNLSIQPQTFRDKLKPGDYEEWKFRVLDADSLPVIAELLAGMYDVSLDAIMPFQWMFSLSQNQYIRNFQLIEGDGLRQTRESRFEERKRKEVPEYSYDELDWQNTFVGRYSTRAGGVLYSQARMSAKETAISMDSAPAEPTQALNQAQVEAYMGTEEDMANNSESSELIPQIRSNFQETAFFYPNLQTDKDGEVWIRFNLPESNTSWKFMALAHTKEMKNGLYDQTIVSQKPIMVIPNLPRFFRKGDQVEISAIVYNQLQETVRGSVKLEFFNPSNEELITLRGTEEKPLLLAENTSTVYKWVITVPEDPEVIGCRIIANSAAGSDGEQHLIPVIRNEILITESTPFYLYENGEKQIPINIPSNPSFRPYQMTLEISSNPVWYAIQALGTVNRPVNDNVIDWFAYYYTNTLAGSILKQHPRLEQIVKAWSAQGNNAETLLSNLQKNEELKNIILEETPWVLEAENETEQKQQLLLLLDMNRASQRKEEALQILLQKQQENGGWGWFSGFTPNRQITVSILKGMAHLTELGALGTNQQEKEMQMKALKYLDISMLEDYQRLEKTDKNLKDYVPTSEQVDFLYMRSFYRDIPEWGESRTAIRFFTEQAEKQWEKASFFGKAETAWLLWKNGKQDVANQIMAWFRKTATHSEELGMYWANNRRENNFFTSPIESHSLVMRLFVETGAQNNEIDPMKQWLLNQKRTQKWETTPATLEAIYILLLTGNDWIGEDNRCLVQWGSMQLDTQKGELATGYIKKTVKQAEISSNLNHLSIRKEGINPAWGAIYYQYFATIDEVQKSGGPLSIEKKWFVETNNGQQRQLTPLTNERTLHTGDKVVTRLTIRTDREMQFVSIKDLRPGGFEPSVQLSGLKYSDGISYYQSPKDLSENFFIDRLPAGTYVLEYEAYVSRKGDYSGGVATIQCMYAPEFNAHTEGGRILID